MIESIIKGFEVWTTAQGTKSKGRVKNIDNISLEGISRLRELISQLAVTGKLLTQNINDKPSRELLKEINKEKERLYEEGSIRKKNISEGCKENEQPFELPKKWEWVRLGDIGHWALGYGFPLSEQGNCDGDILFTKVSDMNNIG